MWFRWIYAGASILMLGGPAIAQWSGWSGEREDRGLEYRGPDLGVGIEQRLWGLDLEQHLQRKRLNDLERRERLDRLEWERQQRRW
jgi:hypothetical protein